MNILGKSRRRSFGLLLVLAPAGCSCGSDEGTQVDETSTGEHASNCFITFNEEIDTLPVPVPPPGVPIVEGLLAPHE